TDRNDPSKRIDFPPSRFLAGKTFTRVDNSFVWQSALLDILMRWENSRIKFDVVIKTKPPPDFPDTIEFDVDKAGVDDVTLLSLLTNLKATDSSTPEPIERPLGVSLNAGVLTLGFDLTGLTFPVTIDPTLDLQVGANSDDIRKSTGFGMQQGWIIAGNATSGGVQDSGMRFTNVTIPAGSTIDVAYLTLTPGWNHTSSILTNILGEDADDPGAFDGTQADFDSRTRTTSFVAYDGSKAWTTDVEENLTDMTAVVQEIIDRAGWASGQAQVYFWQDDGTTVGSNHGAYQYNDSTTKAPKLHIEYTAGGGGDPDGTGRSLFT
ncbi:MAG: hypothetical protein ACE5JL_04405, partial [Dehalococcoidia bacterium]